MSQRHSISPPLVANRPVDLRDIDAVGFDLDHTLALYDDDAVNTLAMAEARELLVASRGYRGHEVDAGPHPHDAAAARALALDLAHAHVVKLDQERRVRVARRGGVWLHLAEIERAHPDRVPYPSDAIHPLSSRFDTPTLWLFEAVSRERDRRDFDAALVCRDVREMLDWSHTRGDLKGRLRRELARFVAPVERATERLTAWRDAGKRLFVVTNSDRGFATAVLDLVIGPRWRSLFSVVSVSSAKPVFFDRSGPSTATGATCATGEATVLENARAHAVEKLIDARGARVLYVGDNARADIRAARAFGWKTAHIVAELSDQVTADNRWGSPFAAGDAPSWFAREVGECADLVCDRVDRLLALEPDSAIPSAAPTGPGETA